MSEDQAVASKTRLPRNFVPSRHYVTIVPDLKALTFSGTESIKLRVTEPTDCIVLNAKWLEVGGAKITNGRGTTLGATVTLDEASERVEFKFPRQLARGQWTLTIDKFSGKLNDQLRGLYRSTWKDDAGKEHVLATTQCESTDCRAIFPCADEPDLKVRVKLRVIVDANLRAVANGRQLKETLTPEGRQLLKAADQRVYCIAPETVDIHVNGWQRPVPTDMVPKKVVEFEETMKMSTYLFALVVGELVPSKPVYVNGIELRVWTVPGKEHMTNFALRAAEHGVKWFEEYFGIRYPGGRKIDLLAIPDFAAGAMENIGAITFRETALLADEKLASRNTLEGIAVTVLHELAHMWFGDLVTMKWWTWLWLNESFATFMEHLCLEAWKPEWKVMEQLSSMGSMGLDSLKSTHPIEQPVHTPEEVEELFDGISYGKGCSVLFMIHQFMGAETFRKGVSSYLKKFAYGNAEGKDLWDSFAQQAAADGLNFPIAEIMTSWVSTAGVPLVTVAQGSEPGQIVLTQQDFKTLPEHAGDSVWMIPVQMRIKKHDGSVEERKLLLDSKTATIDVGEGSQYVLLNAGASGYYRVRYSPELLAALTADVQANLSILEKSRILGDTAACYTAGLVSAVERMDLALAFKGEENPKVWGAVIGAVTGPGYLLPKDKRARYHETVRELVRPLLPKVGWKATEGEDIDTTKLRSMVISTLAHSGRDQEVIDKATELFEAWKADPSAVDNDLLPNILSIVARFGDEARYEEFMQLRKTAATPQLEKQLLFQLSGFRNEELLRRTLQLSVSGTLRGQDAPSLYMSVLGSEELAREAWEYTKEHWDELLKLFPDRFMANMAMATGSLDTPELEEDVRQWFAAHPLKGGAMATAQALERLHIAVLIRQRETPGMLARFAA